MAIDPPLRQSRFLRRLLVVGGVLALLLLLLIVLAPMLLSTGAGRSYVLSKVNGSLAGRVEADSISLGWGRGQSARGIKLFDPEGKQVLAADDVELSEMSLWSFVTGGRSVGAIKITSPKLTLIQDARGLNLSRAIESRASSSPSQGGPQATTQPAPTASSGMAIPTDMAIKLQITGGSVTYEAPGLPRVEVSDVALNADLSKPAAITADLAGRTRVGDQPGELRLKAAVNDAFDSDGQYVAGKGTIQATLDAKGLPLALIDGFAGQQGKLLAMTGPVANSAIEIRGSTESPDVVVGLTSDRVTLKGEANYGASAVSVTKPFELRLRVTPESWATLTQGRDASQAARLTEPFELTLRLDRLQLPREAGTLAFARAAIAVVAEVTPATMEASGGVGRIALKAAKFQFDSESLGGDSKGTLHLVAEQGGQTGTADVSIDLKKLLTDNGQLNLHGLVARVDGKVASLPLAVIDQLTMGDGLLVQAVGPLLDATVTADLASRGEGQPVTGPFRIVATGRGLDADLSGELTPQLLRITDGGRVKLTLTPALLAMLTGDEKDALRLASPAMTQLEVRHFSMPIILGAMDARVATFNLRCTVEPATITGLGIPGGTTLSNTLITLRTDRIDSGLSAEVSASVLHAGKPGTFTVHATMTDLVDATGAIAPANASIHYVIDGKQLSTAMIDGFLAQDGVLLLLAGPVTDAQLVGDITPSKTTAGARDIVSTLVTQSGTLSLNTKARITPALTTLDPGGEIKLRLSPESAAALMRHFSPETKTETNTETKAETRPGDSAPTLGLAQPANIQIRISSLAIPRGEAADPAQIRAGLTGTIDRVALSGLPAQAELQEVTFSLADGQLANPLQTVLNAKLVTPDSRGSLKTVVTVNNALDAKRAIDLRLDAMNLPVAIIDALASQEGRLVALAGTSLREMNITLQQAGDAMRYTAHIEGDRLKADVAGDYAAGQRLTVRDGGKIDLLLHPEGFAAWTKPEDKSAAPLLTLTAPASIKLALSESLIALATTKDKAGKDVSSLDPARTKFVALLTMPSASFVRSDRQALRVRDLKANVTTAELAKLLDIKLNALIEDPASPQNTGAIESSTQFQGIGVTEGEIDFAKAGFSTNTTAKAFPVDLLDVLMQQDGKLLALLGRSTSLTLVGNRPAGSEGTLDLTLESGNAQAQLRGMIDTNMVFRLREDAVVTMRVTPELGKAYLASLNPILADVKSAEQPVKLTLSKEGFSVPLDNPKFSTIAVKGRLEIGTLLLKRNEIAGGLTSALRALGSPIKDLPEFPASFTPLQFAIADGVMTSNDLWLDTGELLLGTQVRITEKAKTGERRSELLLAIPAETLNLIPGVAGKVPMTALYELTAKASGEESLKPDYLGSLRSSLAPILAGAAVKGEVGAGLQLLGQALGGGEKKKATEMEWADRAWSSRPKVERAATPAPAAPTAAPQQPAPAQPAAPVTTPPVESAAPTEAKPSEVKPAAEPAARPDPLGALLERAMREREEKEKKKKEEEEKKKERRAKEKAEKAQQESDAAAPAGEKPQ